MSPCIWCRVWAVLVLVGLSFGGSAGPAAQAGWTPGAGGVGIGFQLDEPRYVTLVIEDDTGTRVRNLVSEQRFGPGEHTVVWDGYDDGRMDHDRGLFLRYRVDPGEYRVRGIVHDGIEMVYEFPIQSPGDPPWHTADGRGAWLADHTPASAGLYLPADAGSPHDQAREQVLMASLVAESGDALVWIDLDGQRLGGQKLFGWRGGTALARAVGEWADESIYAYTLVVRSATYRVKSLHSDRGYDIVCEHELDEPISDHWMQRQGMSVAVHGRLGVISSPSENELIFIDLEAGQKVGTAEVPTPKGMHFADAEHLDVISEARLLRYRVRWEPGEAPTAERARVMIDEHLDAPHAIARGPGGELFISDHGDSHQVKVFTADGSFVRAIGQANNGRLNLGEIYDERNMHYPGQVAVDPNGRVWVPEISNAPRRVSYWSTAGEFLGADYGPPWYGGGGTLDPRDKTRFYYQLGGPLEWKLDWDEGTAVPKRRYQDDDYGGDILRGGSGRPERPIYVNGRQYMTNAWNTGLRYNVGGSLYMWHEDRIVPVAWAGNLAHLLDERRGARLRYREELEAYYEEQLNPHNRYGDPYWVIWTDRNFDHHVHPDELEVIPVRFDLNLIMGAAFFDDLAITDWIGMHLPPPVSFTDDGVPVYDTSAFHVITGYTLRSTGHNWVGREDEGRVILSDDWAIRLYHHHHSRDGKRIQGWHGGTRRWTYPIEHDRPQEPGQIVQPTRVLGPPIQPQQGDAGAFIAINGEMGNIFLVTDDGLFLQTLGGDVRNTPPLQEAEVQRGDVIENVTFRQEHFRPTITGTEDGGIYLIAGHEFSAIFRLDGFESVERRAFGSVTLDAEALSDLPPVVARDLDEAGRLSKEVLITDEPARVDGRLDDWPAGTRWVEIGGHASAAARVAGDRLVLGYRTGDEEALANHADDHRFLFKAGGAVDLMLRVEPDDDDGAVRAGDLRLTVAQVDGAYRAVLSRQVAPATDERHGVHYESPVGEVRFDEVVDVSEQVEVAQREGDVEVAVALELLGLRPEPGQTYLADLGVLRGEGPRTVQRLYWNNRDTAIVSDVPAEARLRPGQWGRWRFVTPDED